MRKLLIRKLGVVLCYYSVVLVFLFCSTSVKAQFDSEKYDKECFLIGTLDEYNGYRRVFAADIDNSNYQVVDIFAQGELRFALFIDSLFSSEYEDIYLINNGQRYKNNRGIRLKSASLFESIARYFDWKPSRFKTVDVDTTSRDSVYIRALEKEKHRYLGVLKKEMFKTDKYKFSFILGAYLRYGGTNTEDEREKRGIFLFNAPHKAEICTELLKDCGFENVKYTFREGNIPTPHIITFEVTPKLEELIEEATQLRQHISQINTDHIEFAREVTDYTLN